MFSLLGHILNDSLADLHQIIRSGQSLTNEHVQYFTYQVLRGGRFVYASPLRKFDWFFQG